ncbi:exodeoxyribonuclease VII large subunit [Marvinbryantia sp.]|uniref:exodeoxyribonuclease VII large subunit n=1 Tax=Marvinbryantia sp. TaxID=2496532 RepID=UPI0025FC2E58|nr:exodeoxyribonuclease VII large subunit [uncultured Marvinbryantia sp.]
MKNVYSVGQVNRYIKNMFQQDFMLKRIYVKGEVSNCKYHTSGHIYFSLKDETGSMVCVMFAGSRSGLSFRMQDGQSVIALGSISVYERDGKYQLYAEEIILDGAGLLYEKFEALKRELAEMGMFAPEYKRPIPAFSRKIGIVTAPTGAAIRDIQNIAHRRNPGVQLILYPALVQGKDAAPSIIRGIETLDACGVDVIIVGRGGGSIEDLWAFNEESVAYAIFRCSTPVISAVGHETDFTIADYVADLRAPTPSAAAELAVADVSGILAQMEQYQQQLARRMTDRLLDKRTRLSEISGKLQFLSPQNQIREQRQLLIEKEEKLQYRMANVLENKRHRMLIYIERFRGLSPLDKLKQGYAYVADAQGKTVTSTKQVKPEDMLTIYVADGCIHARVADTESEGNEARQEERTDG